MVSYSYNDGKVDLELHRRAASGYAAVGFSTDAKMGSDLVIACIDGSR